MATYQLIDSVTVGAAGTTAINFTSIPQTYTDLVVKLSTRMSTQDYRIKYNGSSSGYSVVFLYGDGNASTSSYRSTVAGYIGFTDTNSSLSNTFGNNEIYIPNYTVASARPISHFGVQEGTATYVYLGASAQYWSTASAVTSIEISEYTAGTIYENSTAYLYGISNA